MKTIKPSAKPNLTFEAALQKLESIVEQLEKGELALEDALGQFAQGVELSQLCLTKLNTAEAKLQQIMEDSSGQVSLKPLKLQEDKLC